MKCAFIHCLAVDCAAIDEKAGHRGEFGVRAMCRVLQVHFSGFYACLKEPLSHRAQEVLRQTELIRRAWADSGKVYCYRKLTDDLRDQGERVFENRVARLSSLAGIAAQIGYRRRPERYSGQPAVGSEDKLNQKFHASQPDQVWGRSLWRHWFEPNGRRYHLHQDV